MNTFLTGSIHNWQKSKKLIKGLFVSICIFSLSFVVALGGSIPSSALLLADAPDSFNGLDDDSSYRLYTYSECDLIIYNEHFSCPIGIVLPDNSSLYTPIKFYGINYYYDNGYYCFFIWFFTDGACDISSNVFTSMTTTSNGVYYPIDSSASYKLVWDSANETFVYTDDVPDDSYFISRSQISGIRNGALKYYHYCCFARVHQTFSGLSDLLDFSDNSSGFAVVSKKPGVNGLFPERKDGYFPSGAVLQYNNGIITVDNTNGYGIIASIDSGTAYNYDTEKYENSYTKFSSFERDFNNIYTPPKVTPIRVDDSTFPNSVDNSFYDAPNSDVYQSSIAESQVSEIASLGEDISSNVYNTNSDINSAVESHLDRLSSVNDLLSSNAGAVSEVAGNTGSFMSGLFGAMNPALIAAFAFVGVALFVAKVIGR